MITTKHDLCYPVQTWSGGTISQLVVQDDFIHIPLTRSEHNDDIEVSFQYGE